MMRRFFGRMEGDKILLEGSEYNHLKNVLRMDIGDEILVSLNDENEYVCEILKMQNGVVTCKINGQQVCKNNPRKNIVLFQAIAKREKFESIVQKATELGITRIVPFVSEHVIAKVTENKMERLKTIAMNACKQCERTIVPIIDECKTFKQVIEEFKNFDCVLFANERATSGERPRKIVEVQNIGLIVGSEGGFSAKEKDEFLSAGVISISLGNRILRTETASVALMSLASILSGN